MFRIDIDNLIKVKQKRFNYIFIILMIIICGYIVYETGGTKYPYSHIMYIPIILSSFIYGIKGSIIIALIAGFSVGPFMPEDVKLGVMQTYFSWIYRTAFFVIISIIISLLLNHIMNINNKIQKSAFENPNTGLPNINKFEIDISKIIEEGLYKNFILLVFIFQNIDQVNRYIDKKIGRKSLKYLLNTAVESFAEYPIYSIYFNEFTIILPDTNIEKAYIMAEEFKQKFKSFININNVPVEFVLYGGIVEYPFDGKDTSALIKRLGRTLDQAKNLNRGIAIYDDIYAKESIENYNTLVSFNNAIKEDKLMLVYQPKIDLKNNRVMGVEALLRWRNTEINNVSIEKLIKTVEEAGFISELTKFVINKAIQQLKIWEEIGLNINVAVNLSSKDLKDRAIVEYTGECIKKYEINPNSLEFELTERSLIENSGNSVNNLYEFKDMGLKISIDDYGTGYNSLMNIVELPIDYIKIDKYFIDNIIQEKGRILVEDIIDLLHNMGKKVCAEGVETEEQVQILGEIGCDCIQGYYFSRPLLPEDVEKFILNMNDKYLLIF